MISIITSLYQSDFYLDAFSKALKIFADDLKNRKLAFEIIIIANNPGERERQLEREFKAEAWFKFVSVGRETIYASWNRAIGLAQGSRLGFWNVDDTRFAGAVVETEDLFNRGAELVYFPFKICRYVKIFGKYFLIHKQLIDGKIPEFSPATAGEFRRSMFCGPFFMFTKDLYNRVGPFDEQFKIAGDFDWCVRAAKVSGRLVKAKSIAGEFRLDGGGLSAGANKTLAAENHAIFLRHGILDKIKPGSVLAGQYDPKIIFHGPQKTNYV